MELQLENNLTRNRVSSFVDNTVAIGELHYTTSLIVTPDKVICDWPPQHLDQLTSDDFGVILSLEPELILIGTGNNLQFPDSAVLKPVISAGIGYDFMDSRAVCRTYNILAAEGRKIAAGIILNRSTLRN